MDFGALGGVLGSVATYCANAKALKPECRILGRLVEDVKPLFASYIEELAKSGGDGSDQSWAQTLHTALSEALGAVNECTYNPMKAKCFPGKYLKKIRAGGQAIRDAMQTLSVSHAAVSVRAKNELDDILDEVLHLEEKIDRSTTKLEAKADEVRGALPPRNVSRRLHPSPSHASPVPPFSCARKSRPSSRRRMRSSLPPLPTARTYRTRPSPSRPRSLPQWRRSSTPCS